MVSRLNISMAQRITKHKRFVPYGNHPNFPSQKLILCWEHKIIFTLTFNYRCIKIIT
jgi:hypothetical protein